MKHRIMVVVAIAFVTAVATTTTLLLRHSAGRPTSPAAIPTGPTSGSADISTALAQAENTFIGTTAAHLCNVASTVFDDPKTLADAYNSAPNYPGLTPGQVKTLQQRLATDAGFGTRLTDQLRTTCQRPVGR